MNREKELPLRISHLTKDFDSLRAVDCVSFEVQKGEIFGLLGPNGAGKTTIISCITTLEAPSSGLIHLFGSPVSRFNFLLKQQLGVVPQEMISHGFFSVEEILEFHSGYYGIFNNKEWIYYLLHRLDLWKHRAKRVRQLSGGMKKRLLIAKALIHKPPLLLLDEPTAGVDIELRANLLEFVQELRKQGTSILLTTHHLREAELLCDRIAIIQNGKLRAIDTVQKLVHQYTTREIILEFDEVPALQTNPYLYKQLGKKLHFRIPSPLSFHDFLQSARISLRSIKNISIREGTLEDVMREVLKSEHQEEA